MSIVTTASQFFANYQHVLKHDFELDRQLVPFIDNHPKQWGAEDACIELPSASLAERLALSNDGNMLAVSAGSEVFVYETNTMELQLTFGYAGNVSALEFKPGSNRILATGESLLRGNKWESLVKLWDLEEERKKAVEGQVDAIAQASAEATRAASQIVKEHFSWTEEDVRSLNVERDILGILYSAQAQLDLRNGRAFSGSIGTPGSKVFSHDGSLMLYYVRDSNTVAVLDVETLQERFRLVGHTDHIMWAEMSPDDTLIGTSSWDRTVRIWDASSGRLIRTLTGARNQLWGAAFSPDGKLIAAGCGDRIVRVWSVETGELLHALEGFTGWIRSLSFSPDGKVLAAGAAEGILRLFDVTSGDCIQKWEVETVKFGHIEIGDVQYTSKGALVFKVNDGRVFTFDAEGRKKGKFEHGPDVKGKQALGDVAVSPDGNTLYTANFDGVVRVWRLG